MRFHFAPIPRPAWLLYLSGFAIMLLAMVLFYTHAAIAAVHLQQIFIVGALMVTAGSLVNLWHQFRPGRPRHRPHNRNIKSTRGARPEDKT